MMVNYVWTMSEIYTTMVNYVWTMSDIQHMMVNYMWTLSEIIEDGQLCVNYVRDAIRG